MFGALADLLTFVFFVVFLEALYLRDPSTFGVVSGFFVLFLVLFNKLDKIETALSEEKRDRQQAFHAHRGAFVAAGVLLTAGLGGGLFYAHGRWTAAAPPAAPPPHRVEAAPSPSAPARAARPGSGVPVTAAPAPPRPRLDPEIIQVEVESAAGPERTGVGQ